MGKILGREPAIWVALLTSAIGAVTAFGWNVSPTVQAVVVAAFSAVLGLLVAVQVHDGIVAAVMGLAQALVSLVVGIGYDLSADSQYKIMLLVAAGVAWYTRSNVTPPVPAAASPAGVLVAKKQADGSYATQ